jgi:2-polyprenyl-3-methyl-5-hydroxy-6-metoxy-1,4-benzoquinol methylase
MLRERYFVLPPEDAFTNGRHGLYIGKFGSYSHYNYLRGGLVSRIKRGHFEMALRLARRSFGTAVIDVGCADGVFLASLARHFKQIAALDVREDFIKVADDLVRQSGWDNVKTLCNRGLSFEETLHRLGGGKADVAFVLETLEHIGTPGGGGVYEEKMGFLTGIFSLLKEDGMIVASVPRTVGLAFACQYAVQRLLGMWVEPMSWREVIRSGLWKDTDQLESRWSSGHVGFNDEKLGRLLKERFQVICQRTTLANRFFVLKR